MACAGAKSGQSLALIASGARTLASRWSDHCLSSSAMVKSLGTCFVVVMVCLRT